MMLKAKTENERSLVESKVAKNLISADVFRSCSVDEVFAKNEFTSIQKKILNYICLKLKSQNQVESLKNISSVYINRDEYNRIYSITSNKNYWFNEKNLQSIRGKGLFLPNPPEINNIEKEERSLRGRGRSHLIIGDITWMGKDDGGSYIVDIPRWYQILITSKLKQFGEILIPATTTIKGDFSLKLIDLVSRHDKMKTFIHLPLFELYNILSMTFLDEDVKEGSATWSRNNKLIDFTCKKLDEKQLNINSMEYQKEKKHLYNKIKANHEKLMIRNLMQTKVFRPIKSMIKHSDGFIYNLRESDHSKGYSLSNSGLYSKKTMITVYLGVNYSKLPKNFENINLDPITSEVEASLICHKYSLAKDEEYTELAMQSIKYNSEVFSKLRTLETKEVPFISQGCLTPSLSRVDDKFLHRLLLKSLSNQVKKEDIFAILKEENKTIDDVNGLISVLEAAYKNPTYQYSGSMTEIKVKNLKDRFGEVFEKIEPELTLTPTLSVAPLPYQDNDSIIDVSTLVDNSNYDAGDSILDAQMVIKDFKNIIAIYGSIDSEDMPIDELISLKSALHVVSSQLIGSDLKRILQKAEKIDLVIKNKTMNATLVDIDSLF